MDYVGNLKYGIYLLNIILHVLYTQSTCSLVPYCLCQGNFICKLKMLNMQNVFYLHSIIRVL